MPFEIEPSDRFFSGVYPTGIVYADRQTEEHGDYKRLAFLSFSTLEPDVKQDCPADLRKRIEDDASAIQGRRGENYQISTSGQAVKLGFAL